MKYSELKAMTILDGLGVRVSLYVSGCRLHCKGCHNPYSQNFTYGNDFTEETKKRILDFLEPEYIKGFSLLGGEPFEPEHHECLLDLLKTIKQKYPQKDIWCWTGHTLEEIKDNELLKYIDVLVDGPFVLELRDISSNNVWRGSTNQRIIYLEK